MRRRSYWAVLVLGALAAQAEPLSREQAMRLAQARSPKVRLALRALDEAQATRVGALVPFPSNPKVQADLRPLVRDTGAPGWAGVLEVPIEVGGQGGTRAAQAERRVELASAEVALERLLASTEASLAYLDLQLAHVRVQQAVEATSVGERVARASSERAAAGAVGETEVSAAELELALIRADRQAALDEVAEAEWRLRSLLDWATDEPLELVNAVQAPAPAEPVASLIEQALEHRPELASINARVNLLEASATRLQRDLVPPVSVVGGFDFSPLSTPFGYVGLSVELPVAQRNQGPLAVIAAERVTQGERLQLEKRRLERDLFAATQRLQSRLTELAVLVEQALPAAERSQALVEAGWRAGRFDIFRVTATTRDLLRVHGLRREGLRRAWQARIELERLTGVLAR